MHKRHGNLAHRPGFDRRQPRARPWLTGLFTDRCGRIAIFTVIVGLVMAVDRVHAWQSITVYTVSARPVRIPAGWEAVTTVINLDRIRQLEQALASGLENREPEAAAQTVRSRLTDRDRRELVLAWQGLARVLGGELERLPAIVFDGKAVWYGTDFRRALGAWRARCRENRGCQP